MSGLSNVIVYMTASMLLVDEMQGELIWIRHHKGVSHDLIPVAARSDNADLHNASNGCDKTNMQLFFPNLLHDVTNALGHITYHQ